MTQNEWQYYAYSTKLSLILSIPDRRSTHLYSAGNNLSYKTEFFINFFFPDEIKLPQKDTNAQSIRTQQDFVRNLANSKSLNSTTASVR